MQLGKLSSVDKGWQVIIELLFQNYDSLLVCVASFTRGYYLQGRGCNRKLLSVYSDALHISLSFSQSSLCICVHVYFLHCIVFTYYLVVTHFTKEACRYDHFPLFSSLKSHTIVTMRKRLEFKLDIRVCEFFSDAGEGLCRVIPFQFSGKKKKEKSWQSFHDDCL